MIYGLYASASGVIASSHKQDVHANNLANIETSGFKRALALVQERPSEAVESGRPGTSNPLLDEIGGSLFLSPTSIDLSQGPLEQSNSPLHLAVFGRGYFAVRDGEQVRLTRNGTFMLDRAGRLTLADGSARPVLDVRQRPIRLDPARLPQTVVNDDGQIVVDGELVARIGLFDVPDPRQLVPAGGTLLKAPDGAALSRVRNPKIHTGYIESSNVDPATELAALLDAQRVLEANANMIRYQDQTLAKLVNEVGKIG